MPSAKLREQLLAARTALLESTHGLSDAAARSRPGSDEWSVIEVLAHIPDVDAHWLAQAAMVGEDEDHVFVNFDDDLWKAEHPEPPSADLATIVEEVQLSFAKVLAKLSTLTAADLQRSAVHPNGSPYRVRDVFARYSVHDENHARQITKIRSQTE